MTSFSALTVARFWSKVDVAKGRQPCWEWTGAVRGGYGNIKIDGKSCASNRVAYEIFWGKELGEKLALHKCDNKLCCNPYHIYAGTGAKNSADAHQRNGKSTNKLTVDDVLEIRYWMDQGHKAAWVARAFGVSKSVIAKIGSRSSWAHLPEKAWKPQKGQTGPDLRSVILA